MPTMSTNETAAPPPPPHAPSSDMPIALLLLVLPGKHANAALSQADAAFCRKCCKGGCTSKGRRGSSSDLRQRYFSLWNNRLLYYFHEREEADAFFGGHSDASARSVIDLSTVASVRVSAKRNLPASGRGIELHTPNRVWLLCPASEEEFAAWLSALSKVVTANLRRLQRLTGDEELLKPAEEVDVDQLGARAVALLAQGASADEMPMPGAGAGSKTGRQGGANAINAENAAAAGASEDRRLWTRIEPGSENHDTGFDETAGALRRWPWVLLG